ncbi:MAG: DMT family transporter [bacterium]|jgi:drug/metabolite transporter (DMT)-like permease
MELDQNNKALEGNLPTFTGMNNQNLIKWLLFLLLCMTWGSSFILMKEGLKSLNPYQVASVRVLFAGILLTPLLKKAYKEVPTHMIRPIILSGFLGTFFPAYLFCIAQTKVDSSIAGIMNALTPIFTVGIGTAFFKLRLSWVKWMGMFLGFLGMSVLLIGGIHTINFTYIGYTGFVLLATICYGLNVNVVNHYLKEIGPLNIAVIAFTALVIPSLIILIATGYFTDPELLSRNWTKATLASMLLGILGTGVASIAFYALVKRAGPIFASMVTYGIPLVAIGWGLFAGESITAIQIAGMAVILLGVRLANK